jgi:23S rRNA (guanosine2251-2'-O)-methyltransferase
MSSPGRPSAKGRRRGRRAGTVIAGKRAVAEAIRAGRATEVRVAASSRSTPGLRAVLDAAADAGLVVREVPRAELDSLANPNQGVVAFVAAVEPRNVGERQLSDWPFAEDALVVVLDGVTDPQNLGAAARSAEAAGAAMLVSRIRRAAPMTEAAIGASAGALVHLPHARVANIPRAIGRLQASGFTVVGIESNAQKSIYSEAPPSGRLAIVVGSEARGMSRLAREACDAVLSLPMLGRVASLNAAAALTAALYGYVVPGRGEQGSGGRGCATGKRGDAAD